MNYYLAVLKKYADFNGRARRSEYWYFVLFFFIFSIALALFDFLLETYAVFYGLFNLAMIIPAIAVGVRRLHDIGKSGWMYMISFIPVIGGIWLLILFCKPGVEGSNEFGSDPKELAEAE